jgi:hypothetical protein
MIRNEILVNLSLKMENYGIDQANELFFEGKIGEAIHIYQKIIHAILAHKGEGAAR